MGGNSVTDMAALNWRYFISGRELFAPGGRLFARITYSFNVATEEWGPAILTMPDCDPISFASEEEASAYVEASYILMYGEPR